MSTTGKSAITLSDEPAEKDEFGSHQKVADAIYKLIREQAVSKSICISGGRGSGKSTVIKLLSNKINSISDIQLFIFDAWSHQGDPLKRSFLAEFLKYMKSNNLIDNNDYEVHDDRISGKIKETITKTRHFLTTEGVAFAFATLMVPLGLILLSGSFTLFPIIRFELLTNFFFIIGFFLSIGPLIIALIIALYHKLIKRKKIKLFSNFFEKNDINIVSKKTIITPELTSLEFKEIFSNLMHSIISKKNSIVIVVDNLDRLKPVNALNLWSTLRIFFDHGDNEVLKWLSSFWLIVPIDEDSVKRYWRKEFIIDGDSATSNNNGLSKAFIDKTFQIVFRITQPVLSDWEDYLKKNMRIAFPKHNFNDFTTVFRLFAISKESYTVEITPREIKLFINNLVALYLQWEERIPMSIQALFLLYKNNIDNPYEKIPNLRFLEIKGDNEKDVSELKRRITRIIKDNNLEENLAALYFNVDVSKAAQILLQKPIEKSIIEGDSKFLRDYLHIHGFGLVFNSFIDQQAPRWAKDNPRLLANAALITNYVEDQVTDDLLSSWSCLIEESKKVRLWEGFNVKLANGLKTIIESTPDEQKEEILSSYIEAIQYFPEIEEEKEKQSDDEANDWLEGTVRFMHVVYNMGFADILERNYRAPGNSINYLDMINQGLSQKDFKVYFKYFKPNQNQKHDLISNLKNICNNGVYSTEHGNAVKLVISHFADEFDWQPLLNSINKRLSANVTAQPDETRGCLITLIDLIRKFNPAAGKDLCINGHIAHLLHRQEIQKMPFVSAMCIFIQFYYLPEANISVNQPGSVDGMQFYKNFLTNPKQKNDILNNLIDIAKIQYKNIDYMKCLNLTYTRKLAVELIQGIINNGIDIKDLISFENILECYSSIKEWLGEELNETLLVAHVKSQDFIDGIINLGYLHNNTSLYLDVYKSKNHKRNSRFVKFLRKGIEALSHDLWLEEFQKTGMSLHLLFRMHEKTVDVKPSDILLALEDYAKKLIEGQGIAEHDLYMEHWPWLLNMLSDNERNKLSINIMQTIMKNENRLVENVIRLYGETLANAAYIRSDAADYVDHIFGKMIKRKNAIELEWLNKALKNRRIWNRSKKLIDVRENFKQEVKNIISETLEKEIKMLLMKIAKTISIKNEN